MSSKIDPGKPGLYECHYLYSVGREKIIRYIVVLQTAKDFRQAYNMGIVQLQIEIGPIKAKALKVVDNLINLITDPVEYVSQ